MKWSFKGCTSPERVSQVKLTWVEQVRFVPVSGVVMNRPHVDQNTSSASDRVTSNATSQSESIVTRFFFSYLKFKQLIDLCVDLPAVSHGDVWDQNGANRSDPHALIDDTVQVR